MKTEHALHNNSIDIFRIFIALFVTWIHVDIFVDVNQDLYNICRYLVRFTVGFLLAVAGYYYIDALIKGTANFKRRFLGYLKTYIFWTALYYTISFVFSVILGGEEIGDFLVDRVLYFFINGSFYHFWYFPALLYSMFLVTLVHRLFGEKGILGFAIFSCILHTWGALGTGYRFWGLQIPFLSDSYLFPGFGSLVLIVSSGFSYYTAGYFVYLVQKKNTLSCKTSLWLLAFMTLVYLAESLYLVLVVQNVEYPEVFFSIYPLIVVMALAALRIPLPRLNALGSFSRKAAGFIYYVHPLVILGIELVFSILGFSPGTVALGLITMAIILPLSYICIRWDNRLTRLLLGTGGKKK